MAPMNLVGLGVEVIAAQRQHPIQQFVRRIDGSVLQGDDIRARLRDQALPLYHLRSERIVEQQPLLFPDGQNPRKRARRELVVKTAILQNHAHAETVSVHASPLSAKNGARAVAFG